MCIILCAMITSETYAGDLVGAGQKLLAHSKSAEFTAKRGLVLELFPFVFGAHGRMSARAISKFLEKEQGVKLSAVTINKALNEPHKIWNLYFDEVEPAARIFAKADGVRVNEMLFKKQIFMKPVQHPILKAAVKALVKEDVAQAASILRTKWYSIDLEVRLKARPYLEHRLGEK
jgi:hypothetical protein